MSLLLPKKVFKVALLALSCSLPISFTGAATIPSRHCTAARKANPTILTEIPKEGIRIATQDKLTIECEISVNRTNAQESYVDLGTINGWDITEINGIEIGRTSPDGATQGSRWTLAAHRAYRFPTTLLRADGKQTLRVTLWSDQPTQLTFQPAFPKIAGTGNPSIPTPIEALPSGLTLGALLMLFSVRHEMTRRTFFKTHLLPLGLTLGALLLFNSFYPYRAHYPLSVLWMKIHVALLGFTVLFALRVGEVLVRGRNNRTLTRALFAASLAPLAFPGSGPDMQRAFELMFFLCPIALIAAPASLKLIHTVTQKPKTERDILIPLVAAGALVVLLGSFDIFSMLNQHPVPIPGSGIALLVLLVSAGLVAIVQSRDQKIILLDNEVEKMTAAIQVKTLEAHLGASLRSVAHDLKVPLAALQTLFAQAKAELKDPEWIELADAAIDRLRSMVRSLTVDFGKKPPAQDLGIAAQVLIQEMCILSQASQIELNFENNLNSPWFSPKNNAPLTFQRVLGNLISNAIEASRPGQKIIVSLSRPEEPKVVEVSVRDFGSGIPEELKDRLFQPGATFGKQGGSGLGLSFVKRACDEAGASLQLQSTPGSGTEFKIAYPDC